MRALYVMQAGDGNGPVKIGISGDPDGRLNEVAHTEKARLSLVHCSDRVKDAFAAERAAHNRLAKYRTRGEWFSVPPSEAIAIVDKVVRMQRYNEGSAKAVDLMPAILDKFGGAERVLEFILDRRPEILLVLESWD